MLLTIPQPPPSTNFGGWSTHDSSRYTHTSHSAPLEPRVDSPRAIALPASTSDLTMTTPHRGLPPPSAMTLPDPTRQHPPPPPPPAPPQPALPSSLGVIPQPPHQWHGQEESMRQWLVAKAEEDKRKQEEEKTRQETLRLEQRRIEQSMLRESLQGGVPPQLVPMIYAGMGGAGLGSISMEWLQQHASQLQAAQQQQQHMQSPPEVIRRDSRLLGQAPGTFQPVPPTPPQHSTVQQVEQPQPNAPTFSAYQPAGRSIPTSAPRSATLTQLPRLTTNEMYIQQPPPPHPPPAHPTSAHPLQQTQRAAEQPATSPSIYFHHWVPPSESKPAAAPQTPASKAGSSNQEPTSAHPGHNEGSEYRDSPRKRKAQGPHHPQPPPSSGGASHASPSFSSSSGSVRKGAGGGNNNNGGNQRRRNTITGREGAGDGRSEGQAESGAADEKRPVESRDAKP